MASSRRVANLLKQLAWFEESRLIFSFCSGEENVGDYTAVTIDEVTVPVKWPVHWEKVPHSVGPEWLTRAQLPQILGHLKWLFQKTLLNQDVFLLGPPGPLRRWVAFYYSSLLQLETEYISLSRDTSEADIKQRREIKDKTVVYVDQPAVTAAIRGRVLILEGIEKCERNVLNVLNNLLENREMGLEDGRFLVAPKRYEQLLCKYSKEELDRMKLVKVSENFRVIALGLPVPKFQGFPIDPPLRSRFQARDVTYLKSSTLFPVLKSIAPNLDEPLINKLIAFSTAINGFQFTDDLKSLSHLLYFPVMGVVDLVTLLQLFPEANPRLLLARIYPYQLIAEKAERQAVSAALKQVGLSHAVDSLRKTNDLSELYVDDYYRFPSLQLKDEGRRVLLFEGKDSKNKRTVECFGGGCIYPEPAHFIVTSFIESFMVPLYQEHSAGFDFCLVGEKGSGKTAIIHHWARSLGYTTRTIQLYKDMTERDLLQRRTTKPNGDTIWIPSPLVSGALKGDLVILDGIDRLAPGVLASIQRIVKDREVSLGDGTTLMRQDRYSSLLHHICATERIDMDSGVKLLEKRDIYPVSPNLRIVCTALPPSKAGSKAWLTDEILSMFHFHVLPNENHDVNWIWSIVKTLFPLIKPEVEEKLQGLLKLFSSSPSHQDDEESSRSRELPVLSLRQIIRICKRVERFESDLAKILEDTFMFRFLPEATKEAVAITLSKVNISLPETTAQKKQGAAPIPHYQIISTPESVSISDITCPKRKPTHLGKVPVVKFFPIPQHVAILREILKSFVLGDHLLLIGNQGVGKNVLTDKLLELLCCEREYIQLHRDTTVQSLTLFPEIKNGVFVWEDSPLVKAVKNGSILVVDEADKAPLEVTVILKGLVSDGEMLLADGRRIVRDLSKDEISDPYVIRMHPDFRLIVLANRPGYPFQGNNFFRECGDCFTTHIIDNPDKESSLKMLESYGPSVPKATLEKLVSLFMDLRELVDRGDLSYPYSLRELIHIVKHLEKFGSDSVASTLQNVFHFDAYDKELQGPLAQLFQKHGFPTGQSFTTSVSLAEERYLPAPMPTEIWNSISPIGTSYLSAKPNDKKMSAISCLVESKVIHPKAVIHSPLKIKNFEKQPARIKTFTELKTTWRSKGGISMAASSESDVIYVLAVEPLTLSIFVGDTEREVDLGSHISSPNLTYSIPPQLMVTSDGVLVFFPSCQMLIHLTFDSTQTRMTFYEIPLYDDKPELFAIFGQKVFIRRERQRGLYYGIGKSQIMSMIGIPGSKSLIFITPLSSKFFIAELGQGSVSLGLVTANLVFDRFFPIEQDRWVVYDRMGEKHYAIWHPTPPSLVLLPIVSQLPVENSQGNFLHYDHISPNTSPLLLNGIRTYLQRQSPGSHHLPSMTSSTIESFKRGYGEYSVPLMSLFLKKHNTFASITYEEVPNDSFKFEDMGVREYRARKYAIELVHLKKYSIRTIHIKSPAMPKEKQRENIPFSILSISENRNGDLVILNSMGIIEIWQIGASDIAADLQKWKELAGGGDGLITGGLQFENPNRPMNHFPFDPKVGKFDPTGAQHVGGNTWAGGSGGSNTAGMGGKGGPFRLDSGHPIHQISPVDKSKISEEEEAIRRSIAKAALNEKLNQLNLNELEMSKYLKYKTPVTAEINQLRAILDATRAKDKERNWLKQKSQGEIDDTRLVEGLTGDSRIYKLRGKQEQMQGGFQENPKKMSFVVDVSGSMYRFNSQDKRLDRLVQVCIMIMEALEGFQHKFSYEIVGHSGDSPEITFVSWEKPANTIPERLLVVEKMIAHSQYCASGDFTVEATSLAVKRVIQTEADDYFVFVFSDANLARYGISTSVLNRELTQEPKVNSSMIFIASPMNEAERIKNELPPGKAFICLDPQDLPHTFKQILSQSVKED